MSATLITEMKNKPMRILRMTFGELQGEDYAGDVLAPALQGAAEDLGCDRKYIKWECGHHRSGQALLRGTLTELRDTDFAKAVAQQLVYVARIKGVSADAMKVELSDKPKTAIIQPDCLYLRPRARSPQAR